MKLCVLKIFERSDDLPIIRMIGRIQRLVDHILCVAVWIIVHALPLFVLNDLFFLFEHWLCDRVYEPAELVGFGPQHFFQSVVRYRLQVICAVAIRRTIRTGTADPRRQLIKAAFAEVFGFEKQ